MIQIAECRLATLAQQLTERYIYNYEHSTNHKHSTDAYSITARYLTQQYSNVTQHKCNGTVYSNVSQKAYSNNKYIAFT